MFTLLTPCTDELAANDDRQRAHLPELMAAFRPGCAAILTAIERAVDGSGEDQIGQVGAGGERPDRAVGRRGQVGGVPGPAAVPRDLQRAGRAGRAVAVA